MKIRRPNVVLNELLDLLLPKRCAGCDEPLLRTEHMLCLGCLTEMPYTRFHQMQNNQVEALFWGRVELQAASSMLYFEKGSTVQRVMHRLKYKGDHSVGKEMGRLLGKDLKTADRFEGVEVIVPVPLHVRKERQRGYNQSRVIGDGLSEVLEIPQLPNALTRVAKTSSQTKKGRSKRWDNVKDAFAVNDVPSLRDKHVLLIDDVVTTGATLEGCAMRLLEVPGVRVSVCTVACAQG